MTKELIAANELRIGNLYNDNGVFKKASPSTIEEVWNAPRSWCKAIPLTEEWLLKFGFEKVDIVLTSISIAPLNLPCTFHLPNTPFSFCLGKLILTTGTGDFCVNIDYVHKLQNLYFALTGEELTIKQQEK
jgi:hypothetical protein